MANGMIFITIYCNSVKMSESTANDDWICPICDSSVYNQNCIMSSILF